jgi:UDP-N-acetylglucosamine 2-epimerase (hydrolysing)
MKKKILFVTATRADFGKVKSLIKITKKNKKFEVFIAVTGMHMISQFGSTHTEVDKFFKTNVIKFKNQSISNRLEIVLNNTVKKFSKIVKFLKPDLIIIHGDRVESLACALVGSLNHILTAHIEGGELSGTIDDTIRHAVTKLSHVHFVGNKKASLRVLSMGEKKKSIFTIGSPDMDILLSKQLPSINTVKKRYGINFNKYGILLWHPVTSNIRNLKSDTKKIINFINKYNQKFIIIYPNNDPGTQIIISHYLKYLNRSKCKIFKSLRFEYFVSLLKNSEFIIGNSSAGVYEAPIFGVPTINIGDRQHRRLNSKIIKNIDIRNLKNSSINLFLKNYKPIMKKYYGTGNSDKKFFKIIKDKSFWKISKQKYFSDLKLKLN